MFIAALFTIARTCKQCRCPSIDEKIKKLWYVHTMEYYSAIKRNKFESVELRWMNLESAIQSEESQKEKKSYHILTYTPVLFPGKSHGRRSLVGCSLWGRSSRTRLSDLTFTFHVHALETEMATHSSVLAWRIPGTGEPGGLPSMGPHRVGHD